MSAQLPAYEIFQEALAPAAGGYLTPAEVQGFLCGLVGAGQPMVSPAWRGALTTLLNNSEDLPEAAQPLLETLYQQTCEAYLEMGFGLALYLPDEDTSLPERLEALGLWCQGFLAGFSVAPKPALSSVEGGEALSDDVNEALKDLSEISQIDVNVEPSEEMESAYMEVVEHVRLSAQLVYAELGDKPKGDETKSVH